MSSEICTLVGERGARYSIVLSKVTHWETFDRSTTVYFTGRETPLRLSRDFDYELQKAWDEWRKGND